MYKVKPKENPLDETPPTDHAIVSGAFKDATAMAEMNGKIYVIHCGELYEVDPRKPCDEKNKICVKCGWNNADYVVGLAGFLYVICNRSDGCMYRVDPRGASLHKLLPHNDEKVVDGLKNATAMAAMGGKIYIICGGGGLYEVDPDRNVFRPDVLVNDGWGGAEFMIGCGGLLYIICNKGGGCMYKVNPLDNSPRNDDQVVDGFGNATAMAELCGKIYVICGKGGGALYEVDPRNPKNDTFICDGWNNVDCMVGLPGFLQVDET